MYRICQAIDSPRDDRQCSDRFLAFARRHAAAFHALAATVPSALLDDFDFVLAHVELMRVFRPAVLQLPFRERRTWFNTRLHNLHGTSTLNRADATVLTIDRNNLLRSSCERLQSLAAGAAAPFAIEFRDDAGHGHGVKR